MYIPTEILWWTIGFASCVLFSYVFSKIVDDKNTKVDIDQEIETFKRKTKEFIKKHFKKDKPIVTDETKISKKKAKRTLKNMFRSL